MADDDEKFEGSDDNQNENGNPSDSDAANSGESGFDSRKSDWLVPRPNPEDPTGYPILPDGTKIDIHPVQDELRQSYIDYSMSVIISRAIPDVRDGLKPSQRRILVAMNDLGLGPHSQRVKCAKISGDASGNYHPHGEAIIYPTLVRMAQDWNMRHVLVDKQGNFGSIAGLPPAAMRYTEARLSGFATAMLEDLNLDTVDMTPTYDETRMEPTVLPSKVPNLLVNGSNGIAVGMATSIPPHNLGEICDATIACIDNPDVTIQELMTLCPGPDFPTGGVICGARGIRRGYMTGRGNIVVRARTRIEYAQKSKRARIVVSEIPYQQARDRIEEKIAEMINEGRIGGVSTIRNESDLKEPVRLVLELKKDADPNVVLNQLYQYTPLQSSFSIILLALVDGQPRVMTFKELIVEFLRHRRTVIRRRTQFLLSKAINRQHTVEGLLIAHANIDEVIETIKTSPDQATAKMRLMRIECPAPLLERALGAGFESFTQTRGVKESYTLTPVQAEAILRITLAQLVHLEQEKLGNEYNSLLDEIAEYRRILGDERNILAIVREDLLTVKKKFADKRRTQIEQGEIVDVEDEDLIEEETMVVSITSQGYIKRTPLAEYKAQRRGGVGVKGAKVAEEDPISQIYVSSTHNYLMFFTNRGRAYWQKVYGIPQSSRDGKGRNIVNLLSLEEGEQIASCLAIRDFDQPDAFLVMATRDGLVKKTPLKAFGRPRKRGLFAIHLRGEVETDVNDEATPEELAAEQNSAAEQNIAEQVEDSDRLNPRDELVSVDVCRPGDEIMLTTSAGRTIRFSQENVRSMGRTSSGVRGIKLRNDAVVVGMTIAEEGSYLLDVSLNGFGKRTPIGPNAQFGQVEEDGTEDAPTVDESAQTDDETSLENAEVPVKPYPTKRRGGMGVMDMKTSKRNGPVVAALRVEDGDEIMTITKFGMVQRFSIDGVRPTGRNTQGVRLMKLRDGDYVAAVNRIPSDEVDTTVRDAVGVTVGDAQEPLENQLGDAMDDQLEEPEYDSGEESDDQE